MVSGKTTLKFDNDAYSAVEAGLSAVTLAITWETDGSDHQAALEGIRNDLLSARKKMSRGVPVHVSRTGG